MTKQQEKLTKAYKKYHKTSVDAKNILNFLRSFMPEMVFRTTKLEGEKISRRNVSSIFR